MYRRDCPFGFTTIGGRRSRSAARAVHAVRPSFSRISCLAPAVALLLLLVVPAEALRAQERSAEPLPSPMSGIEVSESQRTAMRASWALVAAEWDAILARSRVAGTVSAGDSRTLSRLASEHNERLLGIFTPEQRGRLERNLEALRRESERRAAEPELEVQPEPPPAPPPPPPARTPPPPPVNERDTKGAGEAGEEVHS